MGYMCLLFVGTKDVGGAEKGHGTTNPTTNGGSDKVNGSLYAIMGHRNVSEISRLSRLVACKVSPSTSPWIEHGIPLPLLLNRTRDPLPLNRE